MTTLTFTPEQLVLLDRALGDLPYREAAPLIASINEQIREQAPQPFPMQPGHDRPEDIAS